MSITYRRFEPTQYVIKVKGGKVVKKGLGLSFFYNTMTTGLMVIPATAMDSSFMFDDLMTDDFQSVSVQGGITYLIEDYERAAKMIDFSYKDSRKNYEIALVNARQVITKRITNLANKTAAKFISTKNLRTALKSAEELAEYLNESMQEDKAVTEYGLRILSVAVLGVTASAETRRALESAAREEILKQQDDAIYKRRNSAIEQERLVRENELNTEISVAEKEKEKREKEMETKRLVQERQAELDRSNMENRIELEQRNVELVALAVKSQ